MAGRHLVVTVLKPPPTQLVEDGRIAAFGMFAGAIRDTDLGAFRLYGPLGRLRLKQWHHYAIVHPRFAVTFAIVDVGYLRLGWVQHVDRVTGTTVAHHRQAPWLDLHVAPSLFGGSSWLRAGALRIELHSDLDAGRHVACIDAPDLQLDVVCRATATPLEVVLPVGRGRAMWSHKVPLPVEGRVRGPGGELALDPADTTAILDLHKAHYPHHTWWRWGTFAGRDTLGRAVAVNLTRNIVDDPSLHECALWVDGAMRLLAPPTFHLDEPWTVRGPEVDLVFQGDGERREDLSVGPIASRFRQRFGRWRGTVAGHRIDEAWGLAEDHHSRW